MALYAFDGTWNKERDAGEYGKNTNVVKFRDAYDGKREFYTKGVGTKLGLIGKIFGGATGAGGKERIREAQAALYDNYAAGDTTIDIVGFSRGAALALHFANVIASKGVVHPGSGERLAGEVPIRFLGLWDTVASFGIPIDIGFLKFNHINLGYKLTLPGNVQHCFHALALDERRPAFRPTRTQGGYEVWFRGVHSDVGGGNENPGLESITLRWMLRKAQAVGLPVNPETFTHLDANANPAANVSHNIDVLKPKKRDVRATDLAHYSVSPRDGKEHTNPPAGAPVESAQDETTLLKH